MARRGEKETRSAPPDLGLPGCGEVPPDRKRGSLDERVTEAALQRHGRTTTRRKQEPHRQILRRVKRGHQGEAQPDETKACVAHLLRISVPLAVASSFASAEACPGERGYT